MIKSYLKIPLTKWIRETIKKMNQSGNFDICHWKKFWYMTYQELGGKSSACGNKPCPQHAAYGLWKLGRIVDTNIPYDTQITLREINKEFGKNAAYAIIALRLLEEEKCTWNISTLWRKVREKFQAEIKEETAKKQQGALNVAMILYEEKQIRVKKIFI